MKKENIKTLAELQHNTKARIADIQGGRGIHRKLQVRGITKGETVKIISRQPFRGPITIAIGNSQLTLGRGMASKILVEVVPDKKNSSNR